jgi:hypothetical protein
LELLISKCERTCWTLSDTIYVLDLHGSTKKNEVGLDRSKDENVFNIQQGASINIFIKTGLKEKGQYCN